MAEKRTTHIPEMKLKTVQELSDLMKNKKTLLVASIKNIPASQFQEIGKKLRGKAVVKVPKKNLTFKAIEVSGNKELEKIKEHIGESIALLFSDLESYDLAAELLESKTPSKAKPGQEAPEDIEIPEGPTELVPGPAISELGALGIKIKIDNGKINIQSAKVIAKEGEKISQGAADLMSKLDIKPFSIGFEPVLAYDTKENKLYLDINIDKEGTLEELQTGYGKSLALAVQIGYLCEDTVKLLIGKAGGHGKAMENLVGKEEPKEEETKEDSDNEKASNEGKGDDDKAKLENPKNDEPQGEQTNTQSDEKSEKENTENK
jgi:large subunit ribosomal protein L10